MLDIGLSLPPDYLAGRTRRPDSGLLHSAAGEASHFLAGLRDAGVSWVELRSLAHGASAEVALQAARTVWDAGLRVTVHGALPPGPVDGSFAASFPELTGILAHLSGHQDRLIVAVHARAAPEGDVLALKDQTAADLASAMEHADAEGWPVCFAVELNRVKAQTDPATGYESLLDLCRRVDHPSVGICWDFGHTWASVRMGEMTLDAPTEFCARVTHTHVHAIGPDGQTHHGIAGTDLPVGRFTASLLAAGYRGVLDLELSPDRLATGGEITEQIHASVEALRM